MSDQTEAEMAYNDLDARVMYWVRETETSAAEIVGILEIIKLNVWDICMNALEDG